MIGPLPVGQTEADRPFFYTYKVARTQNGMINWNFDQFVNPTAVQAVDIHTGANVGTVDLLAFERANHKLTNLTTQQFQAIYLLHEFAHIVGRFSDDTNDVDASIRNTGLIIDNCFPELR